MATSEKHSLPVIIAQAMGEVSLYATRGSVVYGFLSLPVVLLAFLVAPHAAGYVLLALVGEIVLSAIFIANHSTLQEQASQAFEQGFAENDGLTFAVAVGIVLTIAQTWLLGFAALAAVWIEPIVPEAAIAAAIWLPALDNELNRRAPNFSPSVWVRRGTIAVLQFVDVFHVLPADVLDELVSPPTAFLNYGSSDV
ncbi:hypothetical protein Hrd1104_00105 [Halorhabdus sp. CBA1104]|uniref:hypothetical protein n=1 Tax=Halorhabdus sp. CBA1104 TaxID=1380432 RepID=UPI0012B34AED|nr:hypothetical protein [Halorhabdus sp. CBA1104]QGN05847.1 hypothetical protein Hrd1104_00105 [Halorhabdus sp. CBA1104]